MNSEGLQAVTDAEGPAALPRRNGELVFLAPWESRAFGVAIALHDAGAMDYEAFRARLIAEIGAHEQAHRAGEDGGAYYEHWLHALEQVLIEEIDRLQVDLWNAKVAQRELVEPLKASTQGGALRERLTRVSPQA